MNEIMTASSQSNFYNQDLVGTTSSSDHLGVQSQNQNQNQNQQPLNHQQNHQVDSNSQSLHQSPSTESQSHPVSQLLQQPPQIQPLQQAPPPPPPPPPQQQPQQMTANQDIPPGYQPFPGSFQQTKVPKNFLFENSNYYTIQPGFPIVQPSDYYGAPNTAANGEYQNNINQIISPPFQMGAISTPDSQNLNIKSKSTQSQQQHSSSSSSSSSYQQVQELFNTPTVTSNSYLPIGKQQKTLTSKPDQAQLINDKFQQQFTTENNNNIHQHHHHHHHQQQSQQHQLNPYNSPTFLLYPQQGISNSAPVSTSSSSSILANGNNVNSNQQAAIAAAQSFQFTYGTSPTQANPQLYSFQRQPQPQLQQQQQSQQQSILSTSSLRNASISSAPGGSIVTTPTLQNKSRHSSLSRGSLDGSSTIGNQSRATSISSFIPQKEYPERVIRPKVATTRWDDENTNCYQVRARNILVSRREDSNYINGTKLLNVIGMTRGKRDGILKTEKIKNVVKVGSMNLKGVWIPFDRAYEIARNEGVDGLLYPLFVRDIKDYFLTKGYKLKSEDDDDSQAQQQQLHSQQDIEEEEDGINDDDEEEEEEEDGISTSSSKNSETTKLMENTVDVIKSIEERTTNGSAVNGNGVAVGVGTGVTATTSNGNGSALVVGDVKYVHDYFQRTSPQTNGLKEEELYYGSTQNTPLSVPKTL